MKPKEVQFMNIANPCEESKRLLCKQQLAGKGVSPDLNASEHSFLMGHNFSNCFECRMFFETINGWSATELTRLYQSFFAPSHVRT